MLYRVISAHDVLAVLLIQSLPFRQKNGDRIPVLQTTEPLSRHHAEHPLFCLHTDTLYPFEQLCALYLHTDADRLYICATPEYDRPRDRGKEKPCVDDCKRQRQRPIIDREQDGETKEGEECSAKIQRGDLSFHLKPA